MGKKENPFILSFCVWVGPVIFERGEPGLKIMDTKQISIADLKMADYNPRQISNNDMASLVNSIREFGFVEPVVVNKDNTVIGGHQRLIAAKQLSIEEVPVVYVDLSKKKEKILNLALNRIHGDWDMTKLSMVLEELKLGNGDEIGLTGFELGEIDEIIDSQQPEPEEDDFDADAAAARIKNAKSRRGEVYELGKHRLMCGDATCREDVDKLMDGKKADALIYDPSWDDYKVLPECSDILCRLVFTDPSRLKDVVDIFGSPDWLFAWDCVTTWYVPNQPLKRIKIALWYGNTEDYDFDGQHYGEPEKPKLVKNKRGKYNYVGDLRGKHLADLFVEPITVLHSNKEFGSYAKPLTWIRMLLGNCTTGDVYDPFGGSGTTLIACEQTNRICYMMEIDPVYISVILDRWSKFIGEDPIRLEDKKEWSKIKEE